MTGAEGVPLAVASGVVSYNEQDPEAQGGERIVALPAVHCERPVGMFAYDARRVGARRSGPSAELFRSLPACVMKVVCAVITSA